MADFSTALENPSAKGVLIDIEDNAQDNSKADTTNFESMDRENLEDSGDGLNNLRPETMFKDLTAHHASQQRKVLMTGAGAILLVTFLALVIAGSHGSKKFSSGITGVYAFDRWDGNVIGYIVSLGIPAYVAETIFNITEENVTITEPTALNPNWTFLYASPFGMSHLTELQIGVEFLEENEGMGNSTNLCIQMNQNTFHCWSNTTEWKIESETVYTGNGFVTKSINREHNVSCLHYYVKISDTPNLDGYGVFHHDPMDPSHRPDEKDLQEIKDKWIAWE